MGINPEHWYLDDTTELWQVGIEGYGQPLDSIVGKLDIPMQEPTLVRDPLQWETRGVMNVGERYGLVTLTYGTNLQIETVGYGQLAFQALLYIDKVVQLLSLPMSDKFREHLRDEHHERKHNFVWTFSYRDLGSALAEFEGPLVNMANSINEKQRKEQKMREYLSRQLANYSG